MTTPRRHGHEYDPDREPIPVYKVDPWEQSMRESRWYRAVTLFGTLCSAVAVLALAAALVLIVGGAIVVTVLHWLGVL